MRLTSEGRARTLGSDGFEGRADVAERDHQGHCFRGAGFEAERDVEFSCFFRDGVDNHAANANRLGGRGHAAGSVTKSRASQSSSLEVLVDCQPREDRDRDRVRHVPGKSSRDNGLSDGARCKGLVGSDLLRIPHRNDAVFAEPQRRPLAIKVGLEAAVVDD